jgi:hypothetical protein
LEWINTHLAIDNNQNQFWNLYTKAEILAALGSEKEALAVIKDARKKAASNPGGDFGYVKKCDDLTSRLKSN